MKSADCSILHCWSSYLTLSFSQMDVLQWYAGEPAVRGVVNAPEESGDISNPIEDSENIRTGEDVEAESVDVMRIYVGLETDCDDDSCVQLHWQPAVSSRDNVSVAACVVAGSSWRAVRGVADIKGSKMDILALVMNDSRIGEYDDMFDFSEVIFCSSKDDH